MMFSFCLFEGSASNKKSEAILYKKDLLEFVEVIENESLARKVRKANEFFSIGSVLPADYRWVFKDYKVESYQGVIKYVFLDEEAFGNVHWKIEMQVQVATSSIVLFEANASKEK